jgi:metal-dependent amidase/aminoacylase/carboxypeptidase family protein
VRLEALCPRLSVRAAEPILQIDEYPELGWHEKYANRVLTDYLEKQGFNVTRGAYNLSTAFIAEYSNDKGRSVSFNAEYDALSDMGHACGHNLIATASVAAGLGVKNALKSGGLKGNVT